MNYKPDPLGSIKIVMDKRIKVGYFLPDKKTRSFYRVHPKTYRMLKTWMRKKRNQSYMQQVIQRNYYKPFVMFPKGVA